ncbi:MAG TPA: hypothetical protein VGC06_13425 [Actinomycetes bacterium]
MRQRTRTWLVGLAVAGYAGLFAVVLLRTAGGLPPFLLDSASTVAYLLAGGLLAATMAIAVVSVSRRRLARR